MGVMNEDRLTLYDGLIKTHITNTTVAKETGKGLSTNDYTTEEKNKLDGLNDTLLNKLGESTEGSLTYNGNEITSKADSELSTTSENPVQNKVITVKLNEKADSMVYDESNSKLKLMNGETVLSEVTVSGGGSASGATIGVITYESTLIGKEVVLSKDSATVKTGQFSVGGICTFSGIEEPGTYSVYSTDGTDSNTITVDITAENVINKTVISCEFYLTPDGETVTPVDDVAILLKCAEIKDKSYTTMDELLADEQAMGDITMSENAMKYLARSTGFADAVCANETFMTLLGQSAYVDATVLNSDLWLPKLRQSPYWKQVAKISVTIYGGASETITISGLYNSPTVTTNSSGSVSYSLIKGTYTFTGGVSGQSFSRTITSDTTNVYAMPEGALYWYGNECTWITGGYKTHVPNSSDALNTVKDVVVNTNNVFINGYYDSSQKIIYHSAYATKNKIDYSSYSKIHAKIKAQTTLNNASINSSSSNEYHVADNVLIDFDNTIAGTTTTFTNETLPDGYNYIFARAYGTSTTKVGTNQYYLYALWFE